MKITRDTNIWSKDQVLLFYNKVLKNVSPFQTDFFCIAARKKYMTEEQKKNTNLGDTCMMGKQILKEHNEAKFLSKIMQADASMDYFLDRDNNVLPRECMVIYINVNHTNILKAIKNFKQLLVDWDYDLASSLEYVNLEKKKNIGKQLKTIQNNLLKSFQDPKNIDREWLDIDCDISFPESTSSEDILKELKNLIQDLILYNIDSEQSPEKEEAYIIQTHGGCHILISNHMLSRANKIIALECTDKKSMKDRVLFPEKIVEQTREFFESRGISNISEIKVNQNAAVPLPGSLQAGFKVQMI